MRILERKILHGVTTSFSHIHYPQFELPRHRHVEYEIIIIRDGAGKQFVGDGVADYSKGDLALIGSNVPHLHLCDSVLYKETEPKSSGDVLQFPPDIFPVHMDKIPDYKNVFDLLQRSQRGIRFNDIELSDEVYSMISLIDSMEGINRILQLLKILEKLSESKDYELLSCMRYNENNSLVGVHEPVNMVYDYLFKNFKDSLSLKDIGNYVGMSSAGLCRYFKQRTDKSVFECLAEIRIEYACKLLAYSNLNISQVAYESGYNNTSLFNRQFHKIINKTPREYRKLISK
jgi:AraC-like DNA-binding protein